MTASQLRRRGIEAAIPVPAAESAIGRNAGHSAVVLVAILSEWR